MILFSWGSFFDASGVAGLVALVWQVIDKIVASKGRPHLRFLPFDPQRDLRTWTSPQTNHPPRKFFTLEVVNSGKSTAIRCVATIVFTKLPPAVAISEPRFALHWASIPFDNRTSSAQPRDIGSEGERLDVAFTFEGQNIPGAWIATPLSLSSPGPHQAHLAPGQYEATIRLSCDNGRGDELSVRLYSPTNWADLDGSVRAS